jgi:hypothetical protein
LNQTLTGSVVDCGLLGKDPMQVPTWSSVLNKLLEDFPSCLVTLAWSATGVSFGSISGTVQSKKSKQISAKAEDREKLQAGEHCVLT